MNYPDDIDKELIPLLDSMNSIPGIRTLFSCCGHGRRDGEFYIYLAASELDSLNFITNAFNPHMEKGTELPYDLEIDTWNMNLAKGEVGVRISNESIDCMDENDRKAEYGRLISLIMKRKPT